MGRPFNVSNMNKIALHQHDRGAERLNLSPASIDAIQKSVDKMWYGGGHSKLPNSNYYVNIRDPRANLLGYAALKRINGGGKRPRLILATILHKGMKPYGTNLSHCVDASVQDNDVKIHIPEKFKELPPIPNNIDRS